MKPILHLHRLLTNRPDTTVPPGIFIRCFQPNDLPAWLALRNRAVEGMAPAVRPWEAEDFAREFTSQPWFRPEWLWVAENDDSVLVGSVALAARAVRQTTNPLGDAVVRAAVHWLVVTPDVRGQGVAKALMAKLEAAAWDAGIRTIEIETHRDWTAACQFYARCGYEPASS